MTRTLALLDSGRFRITRADRNIIRAVTQRGRKQEITTIHRCGIRWCTCGALNSRCVHARALAKVAPPSLLMAAGLKGDR